MTKTKLVRARPNRLCKNGAMSTFSGLLSTKTALGAQKRRHCVQSASRDALVSSGDIALGCASSAEMWAYLASQTAYR